MWWAGSRASSPAPCGGGVLQSPSSTLSSTWHFRWTSTLAFRGDCSSHCPRYLLIEGWKDLTTFRSQAHALQGPERTQNSSTCPVSFPFPFTPRLPPCSLPSCDLGELLHPCGGSRGPAWSPSFPAIQPWPPSPQSPAIQGFYAGLAHLEDCSSSSFPPLSPMLSLLADPLLSP